MSAAYAQPQSGAVYALTNQITGNAVMAFNRAADGTLTPTETFLTGGLGNGREGFIDPLASQGALILSADNQFLFAVNALSDEISVFTVNEDGLRLIDIVPSGGRLPVSLTHREGLLYVLNAGAGTITGFTQGTDGTLTPLDGSTQTLGGGPGAALTQVGFTPNGTLLVATEKLNNAIDTLAVDADGRAGPPNANPVQWPGAIWLCGGSSRPVDRLRGLWCDLLIPHCPRRQARGDQRLHPYESGSVVLGSGRQRCHPALRVCIKYGERLHLRLRRWRRWLADLAECGRPHGCHR